MTTHLRRVMGITGDRAWVENPEDQPMGHQELFLYVNPVGSLMALTPEQVRNHEALSGQPIPAATPVAPAAPTTATTPTKLAPTPVEGYQQT